MDLRLRSDVDPASRLVEDQHPGFGSQATLAITTFCWFPPESDSDEIVHAGGADPQPFGIAGRQSPLAAGFA